MLVSARMLLLLMVVVAMALPMAGGIGARGAEAATRPCPSKMRIEACLLEPASDAVMPRGTTAVDAPCQGKAIGIEAPTLDTPATCDPVGFLVASATWSPWSPPTPAPPPRS